MDRHKRSKSDGQEQEVMATDDDDDQTDDVNYLDHYLLSHTPHMSVFRRCNSADWQTDLHQLLTKLWTSAACCRPLCWLDWSHDQGELTNQEADQGPATLHQATLARFVTHGLSSRSEVSQAELLPLQVSLGGVEDQVKQVALVARHVWCHSSVVTCPTYDTRLLERKLLFKSFLKLLQALQCLLTPAEQTSWAAILESLVQSELVTQSVVGDLEKIIGGSTINLPSQMLAIISRCFHVVLDVWSGGLSSPEQTSCQLGRGFVYVGLLLTQLLSPRGPVDPVEKAGIKLKHVNQEIEDVEAELSVWNLHLELNTARDITSTHSDHLHPRVTALLRRRDKLKGTKTKLEQRWAYRPDQLQYTQLCQAIASFMENSGSLSRVSDLVSKLGMTTHPSPLHHGVIPIVTAIQEERVWQSTTERFVSGLESNFPCFRDVVVPFVVAVQQMKLGLRLLAQETERTLTVEKLGRADSIQSVVHHLCSFPTISQSAPDLLTLANHMTASVTHDLVSAVAHTRPANEEVKGQVQRTKSRLLLCALMLMKAHSFTTGQLTKDLVSALTRVLDLFTSAWWEQEERRRQREAEMSALYRYKEQTHGDERSENEREEAEFKAAYPTYEKEFMDVTGADRLEDVGQETSAATDMSTDKLGVISLEGISPKDMEQVCSVHRDLLITLSHADWLEVNSGDLSTQADLLNPCVLAYKISADVIRDVWQVLGPETDGHVIGSHLVVAGSILQSLTLQDVNGSTLQSESRKDVRKTYNIYYDSNIPEVIKCRPVIDSLRGRVSELQREWPDHPTLVLLNQIMDRILSFSVSSPVLKFLTGLELLLQKAQDWESNAASFVSMATQLREITAVIVDWRKLELSCWSSALDRLEERCGEKASHWWFHLYQLTSQFLASAQSASHQDIDQSSKQEILTSLKKFVESSSMGEYCTRLQMLYAFHCHLVYMEESPAQKWLLHVLWNLRMFYQQYQPAVVEEMKRLRAPIDKQLKGFVKIARWSDMNYWALKTSTEKSHRTVHKYIKEYQAVLEQPCKSMLGDRGDDLVSQAVKQTSESLLEQQMAAFTQTLLQRLRQQQTQGPASSDMSSGVTSDLTLMSRLPSLLKKMKSHLRKHVAGSQYARMVLAFDGFTGELIQEIHDLQALQVDMSADKEKQKSEARSINLRKRKGLAELFKYLAQIGLSYRKGVTRKFETGLADALDLPPLNLGVQPQLGVSSLWSGSQMYLYRCMSRHAQFSVAIVSPSKELGMAEIERCRGFVEHFSQLYVEQRSRLTCLTSDYLALRKLLSSVESLHQMSSHVLPPQSQAHSWLTCTKQLTTQLGQGLCQFSLLLEACPTQQDGYPLARVHPSPIPPHKLAPAALWCRGDPAWTECYDLVQSMVKQIKAQQQKVDTLIDRTLLGRSDMETVSAVLDTYSTLIPHLHHICSQFANTNDNNSTTASHNQLVTSLSYLCGQVSSTCDQFSHWWTGLEARVSDSSSSGSVHKEEDVGKMEGENRQNKASAADFMIGVEKLVETLLLCVQRVVKTGEAETATSDGGNDDGDDDEKDEEEEEELLDNHLTTHLLEREKTLLAGLCCSQVNSQLKTLLSTLCYLSEEASTTSTHTSQASAVSTSACIQHLCQAHYLMTTFSSLVEHQLAQGVALHRSMGKLLSVLLAVFTELSHKGFCLPADLSEELEGEGATEFKDIEGGGLGEGEGAKDVSDQIETEDQLEEAKQAGQEEKAEDNKDESDIPAEDNAIEMSHDIDGKLHDMEGKDDNDEDDEKDEKEEEEDMEKQMGEAEGEQSDRLDERMWGSDEEEEDGEDEKESKEDQGGGGMDRQKEEMVAKDDNRDAAEAGEEEEDRQKEKDKQQQKEDQINDDEDYDDNQVNPHKPEEEEDEPRDMDLADDLHLDDGDRKEEDMEEDQDMEDQENKQEEEGKDDQDGQTQEAEDDSKQEGAEEDVPTQTPDIQEPGADDEGEDDDKDKAEEQGRAEKDDEEDEEGKGEDGTSGQEEEKPCAELSRDRDEEKETQEKVDTVEEAGDTDQQAQMAERKGGGAEQEEEAKRERQEEEEEEREGVGAASSEDHQGHVGQKSRQTTEGPSQQKQVERTPGQSDKDRSLGSHDRKHKRLKTRETTAKTTDITEEEEDRENERNTNGEYEHIKDAKSQSDAQTVDVATADQMLDKQAVPAQADEEEGDEVDDDDDVKMDEEESEEMDDSRSKEKRPAKSKNQEKDRRADEEEREGGSSEEREKVEVEGEHVLTMMVERPPESTMHTLLENLHLDSLGQELDVDALRAELEHKVKVWSHPEVSSPEMERAAVEAWQKYQAITGPLSQDLCEQLRLILEPSQATKLRGDYRTGKRLNMRKVIPYIASQFRKDKIWLRRSKPSKRQYQILIAVDDSASMADNHSKQLAFESLALVSNALTLLESGELAVCSFGEEVRLLHPFSEPFTSQSGARILQQLTCDQKQTKYGMLLDKTLTLMLEARSRQPSTSSNADTAQLVLILSDGHGVFREGMETVRRAVRRARSARIFLVFVIMDNPDKKGSILDDRVPIMEASGKIKEIKSYMEMFPFPFYIILRDINSMPQILSDSLRQWFELVTASDR